MIRFTGLALVGLSLAGCALDNDLTNSVSRAAAKDAVTPIVERQFPGLPASQVSDCVIDNSQTSELIEFTRAATFGADEATYRTLSTVLQRPETIGCVSDVALSVYLGGVSQ